MASVSVGGWLGKGVKGTSLEEIWVGDGGFGRGVCVCVCYSKVGVQLELNI